MEEMKMSADVGVDEAVKSSTTAFEAELAGFIADIFGITSTDRRAVNAAFYRQYRGLVVHELAKKNKYTQNFEDVEAKLWVDFMGTTESSGLIDKFFDQALESGFSETLTGPEVASLLNIKWNAWVKANEDSSQDLDMPQFPVPVCGRTYTSKLATYNTSDIQVWYEEFNSTRDLRPKQKDPLAWVWQQLSQPKATKKHFINYLKRCVLNRWANFCRTEARRHQERPWDTFADQRSNHEDPESWEDRQKAPAMQEFSTEINLLCAKLMTTPAGAHIKSILDSVMDDGITIYDAINKCEALTADEKHASVRTVRGYRSETRVGRPRLSIVAA